MIKREEGYYCIITAVCLIVTVVLWLKNSFSAYWVLPVMVIQALAGLYAIKLIYRKASALEQMLSGLREDFDNWQPDKKEAALLAKDSVFARQLEELKEISRILSDKEDKRITGMKWLKDLMSDITHQMKTPLATLEIYIDIFKKEMADRIPESEDLSERATRSMERIRWLVTGLLKIAQLESGSYVMERTPCSVRDTIEKSVHALEAIFESKKLKVHITESGEEDARISQDKDWLQEAFQNIIKNAGEYADAGSTVEIGISATPMAVVVDVTDIGEGIEADELPKIFNRFYRAKRSNGERSGGVGIGLALAKQIVEAHDGVITAKSRTGEGAYTCISCCFLKKPGE